MFLRLTMPKSNKKFYAVIKGFRTGIFHTWEECKKNVHGFSGAKYKSFKTEALANEYVRSFSISTSSFSSFSKYPNDFTGNSQHSNDNNDTKRMIDKEVVLENVMTADQLLEKERKKAEDAGLIIDLAEFDESNATEISNLKKDLKELKRKIENNDVETGGVSKRLKTSHAATIEKALSEEDLKDSARRGKAEGASASNFSANDLLVTLANVKLEACTIPSNYVKQIFCKSKDKDVMFNMWSDGGANPNPGPGGAGFMICGPLGKDEVILKGSLYLGKNCTNNIAEYTGFISGLKFASYIGIKKLKTHVDSQLIQKQINGQYRVRNEHLVPFQKMAIDIKNTSFDHVSVDWVERALNSEADALATKGMREKKRLFVEASMVQN
jgi:ribonuclease HI/viroplasmin and RNaseH domain-containing protein